MSLVEVMDRRFYAEYDSNWDDQFFRNRILSRIKPESVVLDVGAGSGLVSQMNFRGAAGRVCGVDQDPRVTDNPYLDEGRLGDATSLPYEANEFDVIIANNVLEHLTDPDRVFAEVARTLKPGGRFLFKTPNRRHYVPMIALATPHRFHEWINGLRGREAADTYPTVYKVNTPGAVRRFAAAAGLEVEELLLVEGRPEYLRMTAATYLPGLAYERLVNRFEFLANLRVLLIGELRAPAVHAS